MEAGEVVPNANGFADTTRKERGAFWHLYNAEQNENGRYFEFVVAAKQAGAAVAGIAFAGFNFNGLQP